MFHIAGLTPQGIEKAVKLFEQAQKGLITDSEFRTELWSVRQNHAPEGHKWVAGGGLAYFVKVMGTDSFNPPPWAEEEPEGDDESVVCPYCGGNH